MPNYFLGIDGGGTKTQFNVINDKGELVYESFCEGSSLDSGIEFSEIKKVLAKEFAKIPFVVSSTFFGVGGMNTAEDKRMVKEFLTKKVMCNPYSTYDVGSDVENALDGCLDFNDGIIVIAGTGSVAYGRYKGKMFRSGGYCFQEGDIGSAYYLGHKAMEYYARVLDGRREASEFSKDIEEQTKMHNFAGVVHYFVNAPRAEMAALAKLVTKHADDSADARKIIDDAIEGLVEMIKAVYLKLGFKGKTKFSIIGSLGNFPLYKDFLIQRLKEEVPAITYVTPKYSAAMGAALRAKRIYK